MSWKPEYILLILFCAVVNYYGAIFISEADNAKRKLRWLWLCAGLNLSVIVVFKYLGFIFNSFTQTSALFGTPIDLPVLDLVLPVGISFYTFHTLSYSIDVYRNETPLEKDPWTMLLFVVFWPMLLAGPIERSNHLIPQLKVHHPFNSEDTILGINRIILGFFKKVVVADRLSSYVNLVYEDPSQHSPLTVAFAVFFFTIQIYCDFSGYCDIALGIAKIMGYDLFENFDRPYLAHNISGFWAKWHMSLSRWFRDYVFIPIGGSRGVSKAKRYRNIMITFLTSGLWHGANWTFVVWGGIHGLLLVGENESKSLKWLANDPAKKFSILRIVKILCMFFIINITWVFFRAPNFQSAFTILGKFLSITQYAYSADIFVGKGPFSLLLCFLSVGLLMLSYALPRRLAFKSNVSFALLGLTIILIFGQSESNEFIYFQF